MRPSEIPAVHLKRVRHGGPARFRRAAAAILLVKLLLNEKESQKFSINEKAILTGDRRRLILKQVACNSVLKVSAAKRRSQIGEKHSCINIVTLKKIATYARELLTVTGWPTRT